MKNSDQWQKVTLLFHEALQLPEEGRVAFLREACGDDSELLQTVESLLEADREAGFFLERPATHLLRF